MVRIGNGTQINTPVGTATVTYQQITTTTSSGSSQTDYIRYITMNGQKDNGTRITSNFQNVLWPTSNTLLGLLMRNSYPAGINNQPSQDSGNRGDTTPHFFTRLFASTNNYVLVYKVNYPQTPSLTAMLSNPYVPKSGSNSNNITGTLTYPNGLPVSSSKPVILQYATSGGNWKLIGSVTLTPTGTYEINWKPSDRTSPTYVRAWWNGDPALNLNIALSANQTLIQL